MTPPLAVKDKSTPDKSIKIAPFRKHVRKTAPHKHNSYFEVVFLSQGSGMHTIDEEVFTIDTPIVFSVRKDQVHCWDITSEPEGYVLIIKAEFFDKCIDKEIKQLIYLFSKYNCLKCEDKSISFLFDMLCEENKNNHPQKQTVIEGLIKALLGKLLQSSQEATVPKQGKDRYFEQFTALLNQEQNLINSVSHYANTLNTTPQNLNTICRKEVEKTASEVISEHIIAESKRLLLYTDLHINEVCDYLNFNDNSHFTKYFKRFVGLTPDAFRKQAD